MKLKTLNDLNVGICSSFNIISKGKQCDDKDCISCGYARELKQEAIKWVKNCEKEEYNEAAWVLKKMFNITEEDLK